MCGWDGGVRGCTHVCLVCIICASSTAQHPRFYTPLPFLFLYLFLRRPCLLFFPSLLPLPLFFLISCDTLASRLMTTDYFICMSLSSEAAHPQYLTHNSLHLSDLYVQPCIQNVYPSIWSGIIYLSRAWKMTDSFPVSLCERGRERGWSALT